MLNENSLMVKSLEMCHSRNLAKPGQVSWGRISQQLSTLFGLMPELIQSHSGIPIIKAASVTWTGSAPLVKIGKQNSSQCDAKATAVPKMIYDQQTLTIISQRKSVWQLQTKNI